MDYILELASLDPLWDLRDLTRYYKVLKAEAKSALEGGGEGGVGARFCRALRSGELAPAQLSAAPAAPAPRYLVTSLSHHLGEPMESYRELPPWSERDSDAALRQPLVKADAQSAARSLSSMQPEDANMPSRVQTKAANIAWKEERQETLEDLDLFYSESSAPLTSTASLGLTEAPAQGAPAAMVDLSQLLAPQGQAVLGEEDESDSDWGDMPTS